MLSATFQEILNLLDALVGADPNIEDGSPHGAFWHGVNQDQFVNLPSDDWGLPGTIVKPGDAEHSPLYLALSGTAPFDGSTYQRMPDTGRDHNGRYATASELALVKSWIAGLPVARTA